MKLKIYDDVYDDAEDCAEALINLEPCELDEAFDEYLDEVYGTINIAGYDYDTSYVLKEEDAVTVRGFGRFVYAQNIGLSRKEKVNIRILS